MICDRKLEFAIIWAKTWSWTNFLSFPHASYTLSLFESDLSDKEIKLRTINILVDRVSPLFTGRSATFLIRHKLIVPFPRMRLQRSFPCYGALLSPLRLFVRWATFGILTISSWLTPFFKHLNFKFRINSINNDISTDVVLKLLETVIHSMTEFCCSVSDVPLKRVAFLHHVHV